MNMPFLSVVAYDINPDFFISKCENKSKPELACNGRCHLNKLIKNKPDSEEESIPEELSLQVSLEYVSSKKGIDLFLNNFQFVPVSFSELSQNYENRNFGVKTPPPELV